MRLLFFGDSITDAVRNRESQADNSRLGHGYVMQVAGRLAADDPLGYEIINRGISGNRIVDLYQRLKCDVWNLEPDVLSILIGINDVSHEIHHKNGVEPERFDKIYRMLIEETLSRCGAVKIILLEPFVLHGTATDAHYEQYQSIRAYADIVRTIAGEYRLHFLPLQDAFTDAAQAHGAAAFLRDGIHPTIAGADLIAREWLLLFKRVYSQLAHK